MKKTTRREFLQQAGLKAGTIGLTSIFGPHFGPHLTHALTTSPTKITLPFDNGDRELIKYPGKRPLIRLTTRPPQLETPFSVFNEGALTPNDAFFVRYHLSGIPTRIDLKQYRISITGDVTTPLELSVEDLKTRYTPVEITAVLQCSGNSRGFFEPRIPGGQLGNGAMGNARWKGVPLRDIFKKAGVKTDVKYAVFDGMDSPPLSSTPDFVKALDYDHAANGEVLLAYAMNGQDLPLLNGYPIRLVVPGYYGTYWIKHVKSITLSSQEFKGFWMANAYRIPDNDCACTEPGVAASKTVPIRKLNIRSFITSVKDRDKIHHDKSIILKGIAFDGGSGIKTVKVLLGTEWQEAKLGPDLGPYSFREWSLPTRFTHRGTHQLKVIATNNKGETQPLNASWNPSGYMRNVVESISIEVI